MKMKSVLVKFLGCLSFLVLVAFAPANGQAAVFGGDGAKALAHSDPSAEQGSLILVQNREGARRGTADSSRRGGGRGVTRDARSSPDGKVRRGSNARRPGGKVRRGSSARRPGGTVRRGATAIRPGSADRRGHTTRRGVVRRGAVGRHYGARGRRYRRGSRWYFWAPWASSYIYFGNHNACYRNCRSHGYSRPYCKDLCAW